MLGRHAKAMKYVVLVMVSALLAALVAKAIILQIDNHRNANQATNQPTKTASSSLANIGHVLNGVGSVAPSSTTKLLQRPAQKPLVSASAPLVLPVLTPLPAASNQQHITSNTPVPTNQATAAMGADLYLSPASLSVSKNSLFKVALRLNTHSTSANALQVNLQFPSNLLDLVTIDYSASAFALQADEQKLDGEIKMTRGASEPATGNVLVATITFRAKATLGSAQISFSKETAVANGGTSILHSATGGIYTIE